MTEIARGTAAGKPRALPSQPLRHRDLLHELARFVHALFAYAEDGGTVSPRVSFDDALARKRDDPSCRIVNVKLNGGGLEPLIKAAHAKRPIVVAPPIATFKSAKADEKNLLEGLALSVELDERAVEALATLRKVLGNPGLVIASGGTWTDPETGEVQDKLHAHWPLNEPTQTPEEHARLKRARILACELVGADATAKPAVHPMRWAGTLHRKNPDAPRLARIVEEHDTEISFDDALAELEGLAALRGDMDDGRREPGADPTAGDEQLQAVAAILMNPSPAQERQPRAARRLGRLEPHRPLAFWRASGGSEAGFAAFDTFSRKSPKYDPAATRA